MWPPEAESDFGSHIGQGWSERSRNEDERQGGYDSSSVSVERTEKDASAQVWPKDGVTNVQRVSRSHLELNFDP
jgi:hypothetical protein